MTRIADIKWKRPILMDIHRSGQGSRRIPRRVKKGMPHGFLYSISDVTLFVVMEAVLAWFLVTFVS